MAKATVLRCDLCGTWDSERVAVRTVGICGPRFELCSECRVKKLFEMGVDIQDAMRYVVVFDAQPIEAGSKLTLAGGVKRYAELFPGQAPAEPDVETEDGEPEELDERAQDDAGPLLTVVQADSADGTATVVLAGDADDHSPITVLNAAAETGETEPVKASRAARRK